MLLKPDIAIESFFLQKKNICTFIFIHFPCSVTEAVAMRNVYGWRSLLTQLLHIVQRLIPYF